MTDLFTGELHPRERLELEAHAESCSRCDTALRDLATISVALDRAYSPLRQRTTLLSPARVHLAVRSVPQPTMPWWRVGFMGRLSEATMALGFAALVLGGSLDLAVKSDAVPTAASAASAALAPSVIKSYFRTQPPAEETAYVRWLRFQLRAIGANTAPAVRYPVGGQYDVEQFVSEDDWLPTGAPR